MALSGVHPEPFPGSILLKSACEMKDWNLLSFPWCRNFHIVGGSLMRIAISVYMDHWTQDAERTKHSTKVDRRGRHKIARERFQSALS
jgi:hypothetical protein